MAVSGLHGSDGLIGSFYSMIPDLFWKLNKVLIPRIMIMLSFYKKFRLKSLMLA